MNFFLNYIHTTESLHKLFSSGPSLYYQHQNQQRRYKHKNSEPKVYRTIPKSIREKVWYDYIPESQTFVLCPCCKNPNLTPFNFEAGHIQSRKNKGPNTAENLMPICRMCNMSMSSMNWHEYIKEFYGEERLIQDMQQHEKLNMDSSFIIDTEHFKD